MARFIDADELIVQLYQDQPMNWTGSDAEVQEFIDWELFRNRVINAPTIDAVPVVRCKDCKYGEVDNADFPEQYLCHYNGTDWNCGNHFCSYGKARHTRSP